MPGAARRLHGIARLLPRAAARGTLPPVARAARSPCGHRPSILMRFVWAPDSRMRAAPSVLFQALDMCMCTNCGGRWSPVTGPGPSKHCGDTRISITCPSSMYFGVRARPTLQAPSADPQAATLTRPSSPSIDRRSLRGCHASHCPRRSGLAAPPAAGNRHGHPDEGVRAVQESSTIAERTLRALNS